jgi:SAM-dependent methyltransferase
MFTNLNLTDMETGYKVFRSSILKTIPLRSERFGVEPEITAKVAKRRCRVYEVPIAYRGRTYQEGKKITWKDGVAAVGCILRYWLVDDIFEATYGHDILHSLTRAHRFNRWMADAIRPWVRDDVLEIGAGLGNLTLHLIPRGSYAVSDIDPLYLDFLGNFFKHHPRMSVLRLDLLDPEAFAAVAEKFDTVVCLNVVEHVRDDALAFKNIFTCLKPGGRAIVLVPRGQRYYGTLDAVLEHCRRYSARQLEEVAKGVGFEIEKLFTFNRIGLIGWVMNGKVLRREHFSRFQLKIFDSLVWLWRRIDRLFPWKGLSLIVIARKPALS